MSYHTNRRAFLTTLTAITGTPAIGTATAKSGFSRTYECDLTNFGDDNADGRATFQLMKPEGDAAVQYEIQLQHVDEIETAHIHGGNLFDDVWELEDIGTVTDTGSTMVIRGRITGEDVSGGDLRDLVSDLNDEHAHTGLAVHRTVGNLEGAIVPTH